MDANDVISTGTTFEDRVRRMSPQALREALNRSLARVHSHLQGRSIGIISANRGENTPAENARARHELVQAIRRAGFGYSHVRGVGPEDGGTVSEPSLLIIGREGDDRGLRAFLIRHGRRLGQSSVLYKSGLADNATGIYTKDDPVNQHRDGEEEDWGPWHANRSAAKFMTKLKGGGQFSFGDLPDEGDTRLLSHKARQDEMLVAYTRPISFSNRQESLF